MKSKELHWFIVYVYPRTEFIVKKELSLIKYEFFLPEIEELKVWKNRQKKIIKKPLFPSYIFVKTYYHELYNLIKIPKVCYFLSTGGKASSIPEYQVELIKDSITFQKDF